ncbi:MAG TPA: TonB-dependent receptor [Fulvivirga sp.]|nr:TonB-dependent receptor [Fulvivirga sp.]
MVSFNIAAQEPIPTKKIAINVVDMPLSDVLSEIATKGNLRFSYNPRKIPVDQKITYSASKSVKEILDDIMNLIDLEYAYVEKQIIIKARKKERKKDKDQNITLRGFIKDKNNGEALIGATVSIKQLGIGTASNPYGFYSLTIPKGTYDIAYSFIGFEEIRKQVEVNQFTNLSVEMEESPPVLEEVVVSAISAQDIGDVQMSKAKIQPKTVTEMPALFGEMDVVKSLEFIPGIKSHSDGSTFYYVRGGNRDQNLLIIDGAPIYNSSHMLGVFSTIIPDAVNSIDIYKGDMPASMGGRLSSVVDVRTKKGNDKKFQAWGNTGLISSKIGLEGPILKNKSSYLMSGRLSHIKWIVQRQNENIQDLYFYDLTGKVNFKFSPKDQLYFSTYTGADSFFEQNSGIKWTNVAGTLQWNHLFSDRIFLNTTMSASAYDYFLHTDRSNNTQWKSHISNFNIKGDFTYFIKPENILSFGTGFNTHNFNPGNLTTDNPNVQPPVVSTNNSLEAVIYGSHEVKLNEHWGVKYGVRLSSWNNNGPSFEFKFDENHNVIDTTYYNKNEDQGRYTYLEPRLGISYLPNDKSSVNISYSRNVQNVHLITNSISPFTSLEVWLPSSNNIKPQIADQVALGYNHYVHNLGLMFKVEGYYKEMQNQIEYEPHAKTLLNPLVEGELRFGKAKAYGVEFTLKKELGRLRGWIGYTYSRAKRTFDEINNGKTYNSFYDRPHEVNLVLGYDLSLRFKLGVNWTYYTGSPYSSPIGFYTYNGLETPIYGEKNNSRLPDYHRMDVSATYKLNKNPNKKYRHDLTLSIFNFYGRKNTLFINYNKTETADGEFKIPTNLLQNERVTSQYFLYRFTPSISYNFYFQ